MNPDLDILHQQLKAEKQKKGEISRQFKTVEKNSADYQTLIAAMQDVSERISDLETRIKETERNNKGPQANNQIATTEPPFALINTEQNWNKPFTCTVFETDQFERWDAFVKQHKASAYHHSIWFTLIKHTFDHDTKILVAEDQQGNILGGLPLTFFSSRLFGRFAVSIPFMNYGGVVSNYFDIAQALLQYAQEIRAKHNLSHVEIRTMQPGLADGSLDKKVSMVLALPTTNQELEKKLGAKLRAQYKKAEAYSPKTKFGKTELLDDFYSVFSRNMRDLGTPVYSKKWFANILGAEKVKATLVVVYMNNQAVSGGFLVGNNEMLEIPWASTIKSANLKNANMWMYRQILTYAIDKGYKYFDFGRSTMGAGTYKFKKQWGAVAYTHHWYYLLPKGESKPELNPDNPKYKLVIFLWQKMPLWLTKLIGPRIVKNLP